MLVAGVRRLGPLGVDPDAGGAVDPDEHGRSTTGATRREPEPHLGGRRLHCPRGKVLGGSSSINGLVYVRGNPLDFERWEEEGAAGWGYRHVLPYFRRAETPPGGRRRLARRLGPARDPLRPRSTNPLYGAFVEAARQAGYPVDRDINGRQQEGFGRMDMTVKDGVRWSAANAYLKPAHEAPEPRGRARMRWRRGSSSRAGAP